MLTASITMPSALCKGGNKSDARLCKGGMNNCTLWKARFGDTYTLTLRVVFGNNEEKVYVIII